MILVIHVFILAFDACVMSANLIRNEGFEQDDVSWDFQERSSLWGVGPVSENRIHFSDSTPHTGQRAVAFEPLLEPKKDQAVWISQYAVLDDTENKKEAFLKISFWTHCESGSKFRSQIEVSYEGDKRLTVKTEVQCQGQYAQNCLTLPPYGRVRALMAHFISEYEHAQPFYIDDVIMEFSKVLQPTCPMYLDTLPKIRHIMASFVRPLISDDAGVITLCTQLTFDRLPHLIETSKIWNGPISAAVLLFNDNKKSLSAQTRALMAAYYKEQSLYDHVTLHVVVEDMMNGEDSIMYPVNFLRNVALKNVNTAYVFFLDADISPVFSELQARSWLSDAQKASDVTSHTCRKCAFIAPVFNIKCETCTLPTTKEALLEAVEAKHVEIFGGVSHSVVQYRKWYTADRPYEVTYRRDMEPYFVTSRQAPLMYAWYAGYGRDKCAYSRDLHESAYTFHVLPNAFLLNRPEGKGSKTIIVRSRGLKLDTFLTIAFHEKDLENNFITSRESFNCIGSTEERSCSAPGLESPDTCGNGFQTDRSGASSAKQKYTAEAQDKTVESNRMTSGPAEPTNDGTERSKLPTEATSHPTAEAEVTRNVGVNCSQLPTAQVLEAAEVKLVGRKLPRDRLDILVEALMRNYGTYTYVEGGDWGGAGGSGGLSYATQRALQLELTHPRDVIRLQPGARELSINSDRQVVTYDVPGGAADGIARLKQDHAGPMLLLLAVSTERSFEEQVRGYLQSLSDNDLAVVQGVNVNVLSAHQFMCEEKPTWEVFFYKGKKTDFVIFKSPTLYERPPLSLIEKPLIVNFTEAPKCESLKTDVVLITKNRPLQTFAFLESLNNLVTGVQTVRVFYSASEDIFSSGYEYCEQCSRGFSFDTKLVRQTEHFGRELLDVFEDSHADCVIVAVDEIIWMQPMDLSRLCCYLLNDPDLASVQLRLGENLMSKPKEGDFFSSRFLQMPIDNEMYAYYPEFMPYDFGYVMNIDGVMMRRRQFLHDFSDVVRKAARPAQLEGGMILAQLRRYVRRWHLIYKQSRLVNNMYLSDGRVENAAAASQGSHDLVNKFIHERLKLDVSKYASEHTCDHTHQSKPIDFIPHGCPP